MGFSVDARGMECIGTVALGGGSAQSTIGTNCINGETLGRRKLNDITRWDAYKELMETDWTPAMTAAILKANVTPEKHFVIFISGFINAFNGSRGMYKTYLEKKQDVNDQAAEKKKDVWEDKKTELCEQMRRYIDHPGKNSDNYKFIEVQELLGYLETFFEGTGDDQLLPKDGDANTLLLMQRTLQLLQQYACGNHDGEGTPGAKLKLRLQREFYDPSGNYLIKAGLVSGIAVPAGMRYCKKQTTFYANVRHYDANTRIHNWERARCTFDPVKEEIQYTIGNLNSQHIDVDKIEELTAQTRLAHGAVSATRCFTTTGNGSAGMIVIDGDHKYQFGVCKGKGPTEWSNGRGSFKHSTYSDKDKRDTILIGFGVTPVTEQVRRRLAQNVDSTPNRRPMAQREFSSRRDSPVMVRLLQEIIAAQNK